MKLTSAPEKAERDNDRPKDMTASEKTSLPLLPIVLGTMLGVLLLWFYWATLANLFYQLYTDENYSFGLLLPLVSGYIIYLKWPQLRKASWEPSWFGLPIIFLALLLYIFGDLVAIVYFSPFSFFVLLIGIILMLGGWEILRLLAFPLLLLFFIIPLPSLLVQLITFKLQIISSILATSILRLIGIPVIRTGNVIDLGIRQLQVVDACSGLRYILSLFSLGLIYCYFYQRRIWKMAILLIALFPASIVANALRVAAMGIFPSLQQGFLHGFSGWLIFLVCGAFLVSINWLLNRIWPQPVPSIPAGEIKKRPPRRGPRKSYSPYLAIALVLVLIGSHFALRLSRAEPVHLLRNFDHFPLTIATWEGRRHYLDAAMAKAVGTDQYFEAEYRNHKQEYISLWIGFFENQNKKIEGRIHSPLICLPGSGWKIVQNKIVHVAPGLPVRYLVIEQKGRRQAVYYWYLQRGRWLASEFPLKFYMGLDGLMKRRNDGAIIRLITPVITNVSTSQQVLNSFTHQLITILPHFIPQ